MRRRYIVTVLTAFALVAYLAFNDSSDGQGNIDVAQRDQEPDYIIKGIGSERFDGKGILAQQVDAKSAQHYPSTDETVFTEPSIILREGERPLWGLKAANGTLRGAQLLTLNGNVQVVPLGKQANPVTLSTEQLNIDLTKEMADTDAMVTIEGTGSHLQAQGMRFNLVTEQLEFKSKVRGRHDPSQ